MSVPLRSLALSAPRDADSNHGNVKVFVRVRPFLTRETEKNTRCLVSMSETSVTLSPEEKSISSLEQTPKAGAPSVFHFDRALWSFDERDGFVDQQKAYHLVGEEYLQHTLEGYNTCILAYGQTGSGKSYTMMGDSANGLIPLICQHLFRQTSQMRRNQVSCTVRVSYFEIYNEQVRDLLCDDSYAGLRVRESPSEGPYVENLSEFTVNGYNDIEKYFAIGNKQRSTALTKMNNQSSRSHAVFTLSVKQVKFSESGDEIILEKNSKLRLVDLAGSERASATGTSGVRLKEGSNINKSLSTLGRVISILSANSTSQKNTMVPYRDSTLTWILKESLGGNSKTAMIACIAPTDYEETLSTLRYADSAKRITTVATQKISNVHIKVKMEDKMVLDDKDFEITALQQEILGLQQVLQRQGEKEGEETALLGMYRAKLQVLKRSAEYFEDRMIMTSFRNEMLHERNQGLTLQLDGYDKNFASLMRDVTSVGHTMTSLDRELGELKVRSVEFSDSLQRDLAAFSPEAVFE
ncbi:hypothetical protein BABINDRAFT_160656 [Babjeviella inositovora NRRL Y-12698]|uniref:Kinesin-like protein n=1 Tax=Babjeviella inositovora NRRL Y-12698 TaxID=984486 RepID=A0A1E3QUC1_9ASCO|nr:uncharacterized protein BABINDRAFT_160656 [Babjeviella inositovora NRRL Y-12698]ODQ81288.1 hypothetical protein BABINDRAFT_160656 [Babjeviella inositovora NRRL Y-12698]